MTQINALLDIRRMQEGKLKLTTDAVGVNEALQNIVEDYRIPTERTGLTIALERRMPDEVCADLDRQVFIRILSEPHLECREIRRPGNLY